MTEAVKRNTSLPVDVHLMISEPERWIDKYVAAGANNVSFHVEATDDPVAIALELREQGVSAGLAIKPSTSFREIAEILEHFDLLLIMTVEPGFGGQKFMTEMLSKITDARQFIDNNELSIKIQADGGINLSTIKSAAEAGAEIFVAGSVVYSSDNPASVINELKQSINL